MCTISSEGQCCVSPGNCKSIRLSNASSLWQMRAGSKYKPPCGREEEAQPCSETHLGASQPRGWFSRGLLLPDLISHLLFPSNSTWNYLSNTPYPQWKASPIYTAPFYSLKWLTFPITPCFVVTALIAPNSLQGSHKTVLKSNPM